MTLVMFNEAANAAGRAAQDEADSLGHGAIGTEHLLLGLLRGEGPTLESLVARGVTRELVVARACATTRAPAGFDPQALATLGIDVDEVRRRVEETFGPGALERKRSGRQLCRDGRFSPGAKKALQEAAKKAQPQLADTDYLLLGVVLEGKSPAAVLLRDRGFSADTVREAIRGRRAA